MDKLNDQTIHRVWQRVQQAPQSGELPELSPLLAGLRQEAALLTALLKRTKNPAFQALLKQVNSHIACIRGMCRLAGMPVEDSVPPQPRQEQTQGMLRSAYRNALARLTEYEKRTSDAAFGPVFHTLAAETRNTLRSLAELCATM